MIKFSNEHELTFCNGSGALAFNGKGWWWEAPLRWVGVLDPRAFTVVAKTVTWTPRKGNLSLWHPWTCVRNLSSRAGRVTDGMHGAVNAIGLTNPGIHSWVANDFPVAKKKGYKIACSIWPETADQASWMASMLYKLDLAYIEINLSCPNAEHDDTLDWQMSMLRKLHATCSHPIVLKMAESQVNPTFVSAADEFVEAYHAINTIPWDDIEIDGYDKSPIEKYSHGQKGGVSGDFIFRRALKSVAKLKNFTKRPIIGGGGIDSLTRVLSFQEYGASAFSIGTLFMQHPCKPNQVVEAYNRFTQHQA